MIHKIKAVTVKRLKDYPIVCKAFQIIYADQPYPRNVGVRILDEAIVPRSWIDRFTVAEDVLRRLDGRTLHQIGINGADLKAECFMSGDVKLSESAFEHAVLPVNDFHERIYKRAGFVTAEYEKADEVLYAFFDGPLRKVFQKEG